MKSLKQIIGEETKYKRGDNFKVNHPTEDIKPALIDAIRYSLMNNEVAEDYVGKNNIIIAGTTEKSEEELWLHCELRGQQKSVATFTVKVRAVPNNKWKTGMGISRETSETIYVGIMDFKAANGTKIVF